MEKLLKTMFRKSVEVVYVFPRTITHDNFAKPKLWVIQNFSHFIHDNWHKLPTNEFRENITVKNEFFHSFHTAYYCVLLYLIGKEARN